MESDRGQATIETLAVLPVLLGLAVAGWQGLLVGWTALEAQQAARAAARAALGGEPPRAVALASLPAAMRDGLGLERTGGRLILHVTVPSVVPGFRLSVAASAAEADE
jgi:hypothetical protein